MTKFERIIQTNNSVDGCSHCIFDVLGAWHCYKFSHNNTITEHCAYHTISEDFMGYSYSRQRIICRY